MLRFLTLVLGLWTFLLAQSAEASVPKRAAVLVEVDGDDSGATQDVVSTELREGLRRGGYSSAEPSEVKAAMAPADRCEDGECFKSVARRTSTDFVVRLRVERRDNVYRLMLNVHSGQTGESLAGIEDICEICGLREMGEMVADRAATIVAKLDALSLERPTLVVSSDPAGAEVFIDDQFVGLTPLEHQTSPGEHALRVSKAGHLTQQRVVRLVEGVREQVALILAADDGASRGGRWERPGLVIGGISSLVGGVALVGAGIPLIVIDGREFERDCQPDVLGNCRNVYDTQNAGIAISVVGGAALITGAVLLAVGLRGSKRGSKPRARMRSNGLEVRF